MTCYWLWPEFMHQGITALFLFSKPVSRKWVKEYFRNIDDLVHSIQMYDHASDVRKGEYTLLDLLKD